jgi:hypothetical protein
VLADRIAKAIKTWTTAGDEAGRVWSPGDILVLVRKRGAAFEAVIRALKDAGVPVAGADRLNIGEHIAILDLVAAGPAALLAGLGGDVLELRLRGPHAPDALAALRTEGIAGDDAFAVGSTLTVPLHGASPGAAVAALDRARVRTAGVATRPPTLDDVYLRLTGSALADAA